MPHVRSSGASIYYEIRSRAGPPLIMIRGFASSSRGPRTTRCRRDDPYKTPVAVSAGGWCDSCCSSGSKCVVTTTGLP